MAGAEATVYEQFDREDLLISRIERSLQRCAERGFDYRQIAIVMLAIIEDAIKKPGTPLGAPGRPIENKLIAEIVAEETGRTDLVVEAPTLVGLA